MAKTSVAFVALFWTLLATTLTVSFGMPAYVTVAEPQESREVDETLSATPLPMATSTLLHMLHPNASELIYGDNETLIRQKRCCCCCDCCCCCCCPCCCCGGGGGGSGSGEQGVAISDMIALASLIQANQATAQAAEPSAAVQQSGLAGYLPYPLVPRSVNWDNAPKESQTEATTPTVQDAQLESQHPDISPKIVPGGECTEDQDCVNGATCMAQYSWSGVIEKRCVCRPPFLHIGEACVAPKI